MYDQMSYDIAEAFISDHEVLGLLSGEGQKALIHRLAQEVQDTIEDFLSHEATIVQKAEENEDSEDG